MSNTDADLSLIARDTALSGLQTVLDPQRLLDRLRAKMPEVSWSSPAITYVQYKPQTTCSVAYRLQANGAPLEFYAKAYSHPLTQTVPAVDSSANQAQQLGRHRMAVRFDDIATALYFFPADRDLPGLRHLTSEKKRKLLMERLAPDQPGLRRVTLQGLRYKPERRYVAQVLHEGEPHATLKAYSAVNYDTALGNSQVFRSADRLRIPQLLGSSSAHQILLFQWLQGPTLHELISSSSPETQAIHLAGRALACLHGQPATGLLALTREEECRRTETLGQWLDFVCPSLSLRIRAVAQRIRRELAALQPADCASHGDYYADQVVIMSDETVGLLDLDRACRADHALDLGLFLAHLHRETLDQQLTAPARAQLEAAFLTGYSQISMLPLPKHLAFYTGVGLFRLLPDPFRRRMADWLGQTEALLRRVEIFLSTDGSRGFCADQLDGMNSGCNLNAKS